MHLFLLIAAFSIIFSFGACAVQAMTPSQIYEKNAGNIVYIQSFGSDAEILRFGSGVILFDGIVVTNCHVIKNGDHFKVSNNNKVYRAARGYSDIDRDVCFLEIIGFKGPPVTLGRTTMLKPGNYVYAIGSPHGFELTISNGIVSKLIPNDSGYNIIQTNAAISPGSSGGGLFDENGALVGLTTLGSTEGQNLNFAVPVEWVKELLLRSMAAYMSKAELTFSKHKTYTSEELFGDIAKQQPAATPEHSAPFNTDLTRKTYTSEELFGDEYRKEQEEAKRLLAAKNAEAEKKAEAERLEAEQAEAERLLAVKKAEAEKKAREEKFRAEQKIQEEKIKAEQRERLEKLRAELKVREEKLKAEQREREERARAEQRAREERIRAELRAMAEDAAANSKIVDEYKARINAKIRRNIVMPPKIPDSTVTGFEVTLMPDGMILNTKLMKSSGIAAYDLAVGRAIMESQPLPLPPDPALFGRFRELQIQVTP